jgi:membrane-bound serine protease (ClpP class)
MEALINPNIAYLALVAGSVLAILALFVPGTGLLEIIALFLLVFAGLEVYALSSQLNMFALAILIVGVIPFILAVRRSGKMIYLLISIAALVLGSTFLFHGDEWWQPAVDPLLALVGSTLTAGFLWVATRKSLEASQVPPAHLKTYIGALGEATSDIKEEGTVQLESELWSARSEQPIPAGSQVRVIGREGFTLLVEQAGQQTEKPST